MKYLNSLIILILLIFCLNSNATNVSVIGKISGSYPEKIFLFFDGNISAKDSLTADIVNGKFKFNINIKLPILCRLHFSQNTNIVEFYIDKLNTSIYLSSRIDSNNENHIKQKYFQLDSIKGSNTELIKLKLEKSINELELSNISLLEKRNLYFSMADSFIAKNTKSKLSIYFLSKFKILSLEQLKFLKTKIDTSLLSSYEAKQLNRTILSLTQLKNRIIGEQFLNVDLPDKFGKINNTSLHNGKYVLINFWASWCSPCREKNPDFIKLYNSYKRTLFEIIGISFDDNLKDWHAAIDKDKIKWVQLIDTEYTKGKLSSFYDIGSVPANILIDRDQKIIGFNMSLQEIKTILDKKN